MNKNLIVDCTCGDSFYCSESELRTHLSNIYICRGLVTKNGNRQVCGKRYTYIKLLKIMQVTRYWNAADEEIEARAESIAV